MDAQNLQQLNEFMGQYSIDCEGGRNMSTEELKAKIREAFLALEKTQYQADEKNQEFYRAHTASVWRAEMSTLLQEANKRREALMKLLEPESE